MFRRWTAPVLLVLVSACTGTAPPSDAEPSAREPTPPAPTVAAPATAAKPVTDAKTELLQLVAYRYDPEGVIVDVRLEHDGTRWRVVDADVAEH